MVNQIRIHKTYRLIGCEALAKELGVTTRHLRYVFQGVRRSARIEAELEARGIKCKKWRRARA